MLSMSSQVSNQLDEECIKAIVKVAVEVNEEKVKEWIGRAKMLDNIEETELIDIATKKRINNLIEENKFLKSKNMELQQIIDDYQFNFYT